MQVKKIVVPRNGYYYCHAWILNDKAYICWCGDSRCYVFNGNSGFCRLSKDHSYVQDLVDQEN